MSRPIVSMPGTRLHPIRLLGPMALLSLSVACGLVGGKSNGNARMVERLRDITAKADPTRCIFMNTGRAARLEATLKQSPDPAGDPTTIRSLAQELLNAGRTEEAIARLATLEQIARGMGGKLDRRLWLDLRMTQAIAQLRLGEQQNCQEHHNAQSCMFPIRGTGVHTVQGGSRAAIAILTDILERDPENLGARWLLNIAAMTVGEYPDGVPARWLMAPELFQSEADIGRFPDVAHDLGLDVDDLAGGAIVEDFDGDGNLDIMKSAMGLNSPLHYFRNNADGTFTEKSDAAGLTGLVGGLNIMQTDYNNDGRPDVLVLRGGWMGSEGHYPPSLLRNNGDGTFSDVTEEAGLLSYHPTQTATWSDFDGDGWLDLFIGIESTEKDPQPCELYRNNGNGTFTEIADQAGVALQAFVKGVASADYNNDGRPDIYVSIRGAANKLYRNDGPGKAAPHFTDVAVSAGVTEPIASFPTWFFDYDNDGWEDLFVSGYMITGVGDIAADYLGLPSQAELPRLYHNNGDGTFADVTQAAHLHRLLQSMGSNYGDLDNDGWLDFLIGTGDPNLATLLPNRMFRNAEGRYFQDVTTSAGVGHLQKGHAVAFGDLDNDGDQDIYQVIGGAMEGDHYRSVLFENPGQGNHWVTLALEGVKANRPGIGARIKVVVETPAGERTIYKTARTGGSFGASPLRQEIGLGKATRIVSVEIRWPAPGGVQQVTLPAMDRVYRLREGDADARPIDLKPFRLSKGGDHP